MTNSILINGSHPDSLVNFRGDLIKALVARGYAVHASAPEIDAPTYAQLMAMGATPHSLSLERVGLNPFADLRYLGEMLGLLRTIRPALIINYTIKPNIWGSFAAHLLGIPACSMVTGGGYMMIPGESVKRRLIQGLAKRLYATAMAANRVVIFQNDDDVEDFVTAGIVTRAKVRTVRGSGVNLRHFAPAPLPTAPVFLMIARLLKTKGVREYATAAKAVKRDYPQARFLLIGMADSGPDGLSNTEICGLSNGAIEYLGPQSDVRPFIAQASTYVLPSYREGTPRSVLEAMAMARPIITTDAPGCRETVIHGENGLLVPVGSADTLGDAMARLAGNSAERAAMGEASLARARRLFDVEHVNRDLLDHLGLAR